MSMHTATGGAPGRTSNIAETPWSKWAATARDWSVLMMSPRLRDEGIVRQLQMAENLRALADRLDKQAGCGEAVSAEDHERLLDLYSDVMAFSSEVRAVISRYDTR